MPLCLGGFFKEGRVLKVKAGSSRAPLVRGLGVGFFIIAFFIKKGMWDLQALGLKAFSFFIAS